MAMSSLKSYEWKCRPPMAVTLLSGATFDAHLSSQPLSAAKASAVSSGKKRKVSIASQGSTISGDETMRTISNQI